MNISRTIYLKEITAYRFEDHIRANKVEEFFVWKFFFQWLGACFATSKPLIWAPFFPTRNNFVVFFQVGFFSFNIILNTCFKNLFRKTAKNCWFYSFKQANRTLQATLTLVFDGTVLYGNVALSTFHKFVN